MAARFSRFDDHEVIAQSSPLPLPVDSALSQSPTLSLSGSSGTLVTEKAHEIKRCESRRICGLKAINPCFIYLMVLAVGLTVGREKSDYEHDQGGNTGNATLASAPPPNNGVTNNSSIASVAFNDTSGLLHYRIYYQDDTDMIEESSWNASTKLWQVTNTAIGKAKTKSPLAAIAIRRGPYAILSSDFQGHNIHKLTGIVAQRVNLYAISDSGTLIA